LDDKIIIKVNYKGNRYTIFKSAKIFDEQQQRYLDENKDTKLIAKIRSRITSGFTDVLKNNKV